MKPNYKRIFILVFCIVLLAGTATLAIKSNKKQQYDTRYPDVVVKTLTNKTDGFTVSYPSLGIPKIDAILSSYAAGKLADHLTKRPKPNRLNNSCTRNNSSPFFMAR